MQLKSKHYKVLVMWATCVAFGYLLFQLNYTPTKPFTGFWSGHTTVNYGERSLSIRTQLIIDAPESESARLITTFEPKSDSATPFQTSVTSNIQVQGRVDSKITFSLTELNYTNKEALEAYLNRELPRTGSLVSGKSWVVDNDEIFMYLTLAFGEKMGVVLKRRE
ncbi:hypothetical protein AB4391_21570 [Vibrio lentus]|uniref:Uncharacterized protein n=1 Tax=Vibrio lentus TaxID=136468 RepID=A0A2N7KKK3_9VIBR|nr:hypothetical protein [Vibrio lentus]PMM76858.1 hypothetical protein BCT49_21870 [Vibrio lentus]